MADPTKRITTPAPPLRNLDSAPFIYFDLAPTYGVMNGAIQIELAARILSPVPSGGVLIEFITSGRLRCSPTAIQSLRSAIDEALKLLEQPQQEAPATAGKLN